ncbi:ABC transporter permease [Pseudomonas typographi]|uniref:ABC transporter permease n=1 Tax=Pseudomonas typographi TaxID=2715964 RepID=UPI001688FAC0|nr:ABC transporter permease [Pseudomonas typographi]MBD1586192.1 ABC transporter permease [Pseudomonas typographi]
MSWVVFKRHRKGLATLTPLGAHLGARLALWRLATQGLSALLVMFGVVSVTFIALRVVPGDPARLIAGGGSGIDVSEVVLQQIREQYGLNRPLLQQYLSMLYDFGRGQFGYSYIMRDDIGSILQRYLGPTLLLAVTALACAWLLALAFVLWSARGGRLVSALGAVVETLSASLPHFWLGALLIMLFSVQLRWLPAVSEPGSVPGLVMPVLTLALPCAGYLAQILRGSLANALQAPFALSARARGESEWGVLLRHALRHAIAPAISASASFFGALISGAVVVESVFSRPGLGRVLMLGVDGRDIQLVAAVVTVAALLYVIANLAADNLVRWVDPGAAHEH